MIEASPFSKRSGQWDRAWWPDGRHSALGRDEFKRVVAADADTAGAAKHGGFEDRGSSQDAIIKSYHTTRHS